MEKFQEILKKFRSGLFTKAQFLTGATISLLLTSGIVWAFSIASMTTFSTGTPISSAEVNDNFTYLKERLEALSGNKFIVSTSVTTTFPTLACCGANTTGQVDFDTVDVDLSQTNLATTFIANDYIVVSESGFYEVSIVGQVDSSTLNTNGELKIQKYAGAVGSPSYVTALYLNSPGGAFRGQRNTTWLNAGDKIEVVGQAQCCVPDDVTFQPGTSFTLKKL